MARMSQRQRAALVLSALGMLFWLTIKFPELFGLIVLLGSVSVLVKKLLFRIWTLGCQIQKPLFRRTVRIIRKTRSLLKIAPEVEFLYVGTILLAIISFAYILATKDYSGFSLLGQIFLGFICFTATVDTGRQVLHLTRITWARTIGKVVLAGIGSALFYIATAISKKIAYWITATDPKYYSEFSSLFATLAMPVLYLLLGAIILALWAVAQAMTVIVVIGLSSALRTVITNTSAKHLFLYRLQQGKRPPQNYRTSVDEFWWLIVWMRPVSLVLSLGLIVSASVYVLNKYGKSIESITIRSLVSMEYMQNSKCLGLPEHAAVAYIDRGMISVAIEKDGHYKFSTQNCELSKE